MMGVLILSALSGCHGGMEELSSTVPLETSPSSENEAAVLPRPSSEFLTEDFGKDNGRKLQLIQESESGANPLYFSGTLLYHAAEDEPFEQIVRKMVSTVCDSFMDADGEDDHYRITEYRLGEQAVYTCGSDLWLLPTLNVFCRFEGKDLGVSYEAMKQAGEADAYGFVRPNASGSSLVPFLLAKQGDLYVLRKEHVCYPPAGPDFDLLTKEELFPVLDTYFRNREKDYVRGAQNPPDPAHAEIMEAWCQEKNVDPSACRITYTPEKLIAEYPSEHWLKLCVSEKVELNGAAFTTDHVLVVDMETQVVIGDFYYETATGYIPFLEQDGQPILLPRL
nr:hypothetical protein [Lachnospiraceae bacterium]